MKYFTKMFGVIFLFLIIGFLLTGCNNDPEIIIRKWPNELVPNGSSARWTNASDGMMTINLRFINHDNGIAELITQDILGIQYRYYLSSYNTGSFTVGPLVEGTPAGGTVEYSIAICNLTNTRILTIKNNIIGLRAEQAFLQQ